MTRGHAGPIAAALTAALTVACGEADRTADFDPVDAPAYAAHTLDGDAVSLGALRGEAVLLNVWATWCIPCRREIPELQALHEEHGARGLRVVGVTVDSRRAADEVRRFIDEFGMTYDVWWDPDQTVLGRFEAYAVPLTVLIDRDGRIIWRHLGAFEQGDPALLRAIERALPAD